MMEISVSCLVITKRTIDSNTLHLYTDKVDTQNNYFNFCTLDSNFFFFLFASVNMH